jgi:(1->4)-alpha-D-glucan 1-alpha-D-glucosylmutase
MRFQQLTGPVMAKGLEDTTFYNFNRLISVNEVGGNPDSFGNSVDDFHRYNLQKSAHWPHSMLATATHDTKRGEDVRARINVLSEFPEEWRGALNRWRELNSTRKSIANGVPAPHPNDEYFFYQTLIGAWPAEISTADEFRAFRERIVECMLKSIKEAKTRTSWIEPNVQYEDATRRFIEQALEGSSTNAFLDDFKTFQQNIAFFGRLNSLSQVLLKMTAPGMPDFYQGTELWDLNLVDPDNRRPVDYAIRRQLLHELRGEIDHGPTVPAEFLANLLKDDEVGRSKLYLIWRALEFRNRHRALFDRGNYVALAVEGAKKEHVCAFARVHGDQIAIIVAPRLIAGLTNGRSRLPLGPEIWGDTMVNLPGECDRLLNVLTNERVGISGSGRENGLLVGQLLAQFPVALLGRGAETR